MGEMEITKKWAKAALKATEILVEKYRRGRRYVGCPFCQVDDDFEIDKECGACPWMVFKGRACTNLPNYIGDSLPLRLRRLYGWRKRLNNIIAK